MPSGLKYSQEFKNEAVARVREGKLPVAKIALDLGISKDALYARVRKANKGLSYDQINESERNRALLKEIARLKMENELLRKASVYFAK